MCWAVAAYGTEEGNVLEKGQPTGRGMDPVIRSMQRPVSVSNLVLCCWWLRDVIFYYHKNGLQCNQNTCIPIKNLMFILNSQHNVLIIITFQNSESCLQIVLQFKKHTN